MTIPSTRLRRFAALTFLTPLIALSVVACSSSGASDSAAPAGTSPAGGPDLSGVTLNVGSFYEYQIEGIKKSGILDDAPYNIEWSVQTAAGPAVEALNAEAVDVVWGLSSTAAEKVAGDASPELTPDTVNFKNIALLYPDNQEELPRTVVLAGKDATDVNSLADLKGHSVGFNSGGNNHAAYLLALHAGGLTAADIEPVDVPYKDRPQILRTGDLDVDVNGYEVSVTAESEGARVIATGKDIGYPNATAIVARTAIIEDPTTSAAVEDLLGRIVAYGAWWKDNIEENGKFLAEFISISEADGLLRARLNSTIVIPVDDESIAAEQEIFDKVQPLGFAKHGADLELVHDTTYADAVKAANAEAGITPEGESSTTTTAKAGS